MVYAVLLGVCLVEPARESAEGMTRSNEPTGATTSESPSDRLPLRCCEKIVRIVTQSRRRPCCSAVFVGANFVAATFLTWLPLVHLRAFRPGI